jgi:imidazolonepropionase-like amidohydrolase
MKLRNSAIVLVLVAACAHQPRREETLRYSVVMAGKVAGTQVVTTRGDEIAVDFEFNDRGRGPKLHTVMRTDARGVLTSIATTGNDYLKTQVEEQFRVDGGRATWKNSSEAGDAEAGAFYSSMYGPPEESAILARALLKAGGRLALHPAGEATIRKVGDTTLRDGKRVTAYEIGGLGFTPYEVWLDDDLRYFGTISSWSSVIAEGYESEIKHFVELQDQRDKSRGIEIAKRLTKAPVRVVVINARVFDPRTGKLSDPTTVVTAGNRIASVGIENPYSAAELIDAKGGVLLPGLWDMHVHADDTDGLLNIAAGITSARDLGNDSDTIVALREQWDAGTTIGPRLVLAGLIDGPGPFQGPTNLLVATEEEGRKAIDFLASRGYEGVKIYSSIKPELVPFLTRYAHEKGLRVSGHIPAGMTADKAVDAGYDEIQHVNMLFLNFMADVTDTRTPARFVEPGKRGGSLDLRSPEVRAFIAKLKANNVVVDPTVSVFEGMYTARKGVMDPGYAMIADRLPPQMRRNFLVGGLPIADADTDQRYRASYARMLDLVAELHRSGVTIVAGTDGLAGFTLHRELENYVRAGISAADALKIATLVPAQVLKRDQDLGTIEPGKLADFVIVDGDPTKNISDIRKITWVVKDGKLFDPKEIYAELGVRP